MTVLMKRRKIGAAVIVLGVLVLIASATLYIYTSRDEQRADDTAREVLDDLMQVIPHGVSAPSEQFADPAGAYTEKTVVADGKEYLGYVTFVGYDRTLPVLAEWDFDALENTPARYKGSIETNDIIIAGHNYKSHFNPINRMVPGNEVIFTDAGGVEIVYLVSEVETLKPTAVTEMESGSWDMTLFTCTNRGQARKALRCTRLSSDITG